MAAVLAVLLLVITSTEPAEAAFPGTNGKIFYEHGNSIWSMNPDGTGRPNSSATTIATRKAPAVSPDDTKIAYEYRHNM